MKIFKDKNKKQSILSVILFLVIIALYLEINILLNKINIKDIDFTDSKLYSITNESKEKISKIDKDIEINLINFDNYSSYRPIEDVVNLIKEYSEVNNKISVKNSESEDANESNYPYINISANGKEQIISLDDLFLYKYSTDTYSDDEYYLTEEVITNTLVNIAKESEKKTYIYLEKSVYNEKYFSTLIKRIKYMGNGIEKLELSKNNNIPEDCNCLVIPPLLTDISDQEKNIIVDYINNGGNIMFLEESKSLLKTETPNLNFIMNLYGFSISEGVIIETDNRVQKDPGVIYANINLDNDIYKTLNKNSKITLVDTGKINLENEEKLKELGVSYKVLINSGNTAYLRTDMSNTSTEISDSDTKIENEIIGLSIIRKNGDNESKAIVYANSLFATNQGIYVQDVVTEKNVGVELVKLNDNEEILVDSIKYLTENNDTVIKRKRHYNSVPSINLLKDGITLKLVFVLPMIIIFIGYFVWRYRRNMK